jgi:hypothetical protein
LWTSTKITATKLHAVNMAPAGETITRDKYETQLNAQKLVTRKNVLIHKIPLVMVKCGNEG